MSIHPDHSFGYDMRLFLADICFDVNPFFKSFDESLFCNCFRLLAEDAAAKGVIKTTTCPKETA